MTATSIFDREVVLPDDQLTRQAQTLLGFEARYQRVNRQLRLLLHLDDLAGWSKRHHGRTTRICSFVAEQYPLVIFHGDVGTGKTVTAEGIANRLILEDAAADDSVLYKLSTRVRGTGKVGEMGTLINQAFEDIVRAAKHRRAILIIDEGDSLASARTQEHSHHEDKVAVNTLIQRIDDLKQYCGRILVILCTNRLSALDPAIIRRAAVVDAFTRPSDEERHDLFLQDLGDLGLSGDDLERLVAATGTHGVPWTYSDIRTRLYPAALSRAYPDERLGITYLLDAARSLTPSPVLEDR